VLSGKLKLVPRRVRPSWPVKSEDVSQIVRDGAVPVPASGKPLVSLLDKLTPKRMLSDNFVNNR
jgi:hypothetical protein